MKNAEYTVTIESCASNGQGVARIDGQVVFVKGALRGETCTVRILKSVGGAAYAKIIDIIEQSPHRTVPGCVSFGKCGGCDFLHMDYAEELDCKRQRVEDALRRIGGVCVEVPPVAGSDTQEKYRNKAIYAVGGKTGAAVAGFYRQRSHDIIPAPDCLIQSGVSKRAAESVIRWMNLRKIPPYDEGTHSGAIRHISCRYAGTTDTAQVTVVSAEEKLPYTHELTAEIRKNCPEVTSVVLNINKTRGNTVLSGQFRTLWGGAYIVDELCSLKFRLSPRSFYQVNRVQAERIYEKVTELAALTKTDTALDLYCGTGTITLLLARTAGRVIGAEIVAEAVSDARENAAQNGVTNAEFICADASEISERIRKEGVRPAAVVVDPPRKGLASSVIDAIAGMSPRRVVYVSCDPATLARDLKLFAQHGYMTKSVTPFDMFPRCAHVECVSLLTAVF